MRLHLRSLAEFATTMADAAAAWRQARRRTEWVDDGVCGCTDCCPSWLAGDDRPAGTALPAALAAREGELWPS